MEQVPANVKAQKDAADKLLEDLENRGAATPPGPPAIPAPAAQAPAAEPPKPGEGTPPLYPAAPQPVPVVDDPVELKRQLSEVMAALDALQAEFARVQHHESVLEGKLKTEGPQFAQQIRDQKAELDKLKAEIEVLRSKAPAADAAKSDEPLTDLDKQLMDELALEEPAYRLFVQRFGQPKAEARQAAPPAAEPQPAVVEPQAPPAQPTLSPARAAFNTLMDVKAKGWQEARKDPRFADFVHGTAEATSGRSLIDILAEADTALNSDIVAKIYQEYFKTVAPAPAEPTKPSRETAPTSKKAGSDEPGETEVWTVERIAQFEKDVATGKIRMGSEEYKTLKTSRDKALDGATFGSR